MDSRLEQSFQNLESNLLSTKVKERKVCLCLAPLYVCKGQLSRVQQPLRPGVRSGGAQTAEPAAGQRGGLACA